MGVDTRITLPPAARVGDVAKVVGILLGLKSSKEPLHDDTWYVAVPGAAIEPSGVVECALIALKGPVSVFDGEASVHLLYHFEGDHDGSRLLMPRSYAGWIALGRRLVDFFGGEVDYADCDAADVDYSVPRKDWHEIAPKDGEEWHAFQQRMLDLPPITKADVKACQQYAAYR